jgi:hypothetical protein
MIDDITRKWYHASVINPDPFTAVTNIIGMWRGMKDMDKEYYDKLDDEAKGCIKLFSNFFFIHDNIAKAKVVQIDKDLLPSILSTDNELFFRNTGLPVMFINQDFQYNPNILIKGIMIANTKELMAHADPFTKLEFLIEDKKELLNPHLLMLVLYIDMTTPNYTEQWLGYTIENYQEKYHNDKINLKICKYASTIACNIIDVMNHDVENIEINTIISTREENEKRIKRGKPPVATKVYIRPKSEQRNYYINLNTQISENGIGHKFLVRGHWRHFRSEKWKNKKGQSTWIRPTIKGRGIFIEKKYQLEGE